jgi:hypothetical protein
MKNNIKTMGRTPDSTAVEAFVPHHAEILRHRFILQSSPAKVNSLFSIQIKVPRKT